MPAATLPLGPINPHIKQSSGGDINIYKFYHTRYGSEYGIEGYRPREGRHTGTGYSSNFRPQYFYSKKSDDNIVMSRILNDAYDSVTTKSFRPLDRPDGSDHLPCVNFNIGSGYTRVKPITNPTESEVFEPFVNTKPHSAGPILPNYKPHLHKIQSKDPVAAENFDNGPAYMSTQYDWNYNDREPKKKDIFPKTYGQLQKTAHLSNHNIEPITYHEDRAHKLPPTFDRVTGNSIYQCDYKPMELPDGKESLPYGLGGENNTAYTREMFPQVGYRPSDDTLTYASKDQLPQSLLDIERKRDPANFLNVTHPNNKSGIYPHFYKGDQRADPSVAARLGTETCGPKELTGFKENSTVQVPSTIVHENQDNRRYLTHYDHQFHDKNTVGDRREGRVIGAVQPHTENAFTKSEKLHATAKPLNTVEHLAQQDPYQARSMANRDVFFDDHTHDHKRSDYVPTVHTKESFLKSTMNIQRPRIEQKDTNPIYTGVRVGTPRQNVLQHAAVSSGFVPLQ